jgi:hypothetical protein
VLGVVREGVWVGIREKQNMGKLWKAEIVGLIRDAGLEGSGRLKYTVVG